MLSFPTDCSGVRYKEVLGASATSPMVMILEEVD